MIDYRIKYLKYKAKYLKNRASQMHGGKVHSAGNKIHAICTINGDRVYDKNTQIHGTVYLDEMDDGNTWIHGTITGLTNGNHGFHIHESADLTQCCKSLKAHYNPFGKHHGGHTDQNRHVGDLGNIHVENNEANIDIVDDLIKLSGEYSVIGRSLIIHKDEDDLGKGGLNEKGEIIDEKRRIESLKTGNAGDRIACGIIGLK